MVLRGDVAAETTSVPLTKPLLTVLCLRHRDAHHCGDLDPFRTTGQTSVDFSNHRFPFDFGNCACMVRSPSHEEHSACDRLIKVAIMKLGFIWISSTGTTLGQRKVNTVDTFSSKNVLRHFITGNRKKRIREVMSDHSLSS